MDDLAADFPPFGLRICHEDMVLRLMRDTDLPEYLDLLSGPIFPDETAPWVFPWYRASVPQRRRNAMQAQWTFRSQIKPESWTLAFGVYVDDVLVGCQDLATQDFQRLRVVHSGSWLALNNQSKGWGKRMRKLILHLAFDHLHARRATSAAIIGNKPSLAVSLNAGYDLNGTTWTTWGDDIAELQHVAVTLDKFQRLNNVTVEGLTDDLRTMLGATSCGSDSEDES